VDAEKRGAFARLYRDWTQDLHTFADVVYDAKRLIMQVSLASEVHMLAYQFDRLAQQHRRSRDFVLKAGRDVWDHRATSWIAGGGETPDIQERREDAKAPIRTYEPRDFGLTSCHSLSTLKGGQR
jgi:hypothetical protein